MFRGNILPPPSGFNLKTNSGYPPARLHGDFSGTCYLELKGSTLKMEAAYSSETSTFAYKTTRCHNPED
jgi:hypothetical protein